MDGCGSLTVFFLQCAVRSYLLTIHISWDDSAMTSPLPVDSVVLKGFVLLLVRHLMMRVFGFTYMEEALQDIWMGMAAIFLCIRYYDTSAEEGAVRLVGLCLILIFSTMWHLISALCLGCKWETAYKNCYGLQVSPGSAIVLGMAISVMQNTVLVQLHWIFFDLRGVHLLLPLSPPTHT